jgi:hypothetical protein
MTFGSGWRRGVTPAVTAPIIGVRPLSRLKGNLGAIGVTFTADRRAALEKASAVDPGFSNDLLNRPGTRRHVFDGSGLLPEVSWRVTFLFPAPLALSALAHGLILVPRSTRTRRPGQGYDVLGAVTVTAGLLLVVFYARRAAERRLGQPAHRRLVRPGGDPARSPRHAVQNAAANS